MASSGNHIEVDGEECCQPSVKNVNNAMLVSPDTTDDCTCENFVHLMPVELQEENIDAIIICSPEDRQAVEEFESHLVKDIRFRLGNQWMKPRVKVLDDVRGNESGFLERIFARTTYTFLFLTKSFCEEQWTLLISHACLTDTLNDHDKQWSVIPVHTLNKASRNYTLPYLFRAVKPIEYLQVDQFYKEAITAMFTRKAQERLRRETKLNKKRKEYFNKHKSELLDMYTLSMSGAPCFRMAPSDITLHGPGTSMHAIHQEGQKERIKDTISQPTTEVAYQSSRNICAFSNAGNNRNIIFPAPVLSSDEQTDKLNSSFNQCSLSMNESSSSVGERDADSYGFTDAGSSSFDYRQNYFSSVGRSNAYRDSFSSEFSGSKSSPPSSSSRNSSTISRDVLTNQQDTTSSQPNIIVNKTYNNYYNIRFEDVDNVAIGSHAAINMNKEKNELSGSCESDSNFPDKEEDGADGLVIDRPPSTFVESGRRIPPDPHHSFSASQGVVREGFTDLMDPRSFATTTVNESESGANHSDETSVKHMQ